jgi:subtilisin family serine protease
MHPYRRLLLAISLILTLTSHTYAADDGRRLVTFPTLDLSTAIGEATAVSLITAVGGSVVHTLAFVDALAVQLPLATLSDAVLALLDSPLVGEVLEDPIGIVDPIIPSAAPLLEDEDWGMDHIDAQEVRRRWPDVLGTGVWVAILDTGIDRDHVELTVSGGYNAMSRGRSPDDDHGHGTHIAGIIGAHINSQGIIGLAPEAILIPVKVLDRTGRGHLSDLLKGLEWVSQQTIRLLNMSLQFPAPHPTLEKAIHTLHDQGKIMVAAAGNHCDDGAADDGDGGDGGECWSSDSGVAYPAAYTFGVIPVGATDIQGHVTDYSRGGDAMAQAGVVAPGGSKPSGVKILSTTVGGGYGDGSGTSQAAAHVTGTLALALQLKPSLSFSEAVSLLRGNAIGLGEPASHQGAGLINAAEVVEDLL